MTPARAPSMAPAPIVMWSATPTCPPNMAKSPTVTLPDMPVCDDNQAMPADRAVVSDLDEIVDLGALADDRIAGRAAVDRGVGADFDVVLNDDAPGLRNFLMASAAMADSRSRPDRCATPGWMITRSPISAWRIEAPAPIAQSRPMRTSGPITAPAAITVPAPISARGPITASGSMVTPASSRAVGCTCAPAARPLAPNSDDGRSAAGKQRARDRDEARHRDAASPARQGRAAPRPQNAARSGRRRRACRQLAEIFRIVEKADVGCAAPYRAAQYCRCAGRADRRRAAWRASARRSRRSSTRSPV